MTSPKHGETIHRNDWIKGTLIGCHPITVSSAARLGTESPCLLWHWPKDCLNNCPALKQETEMCGFETRAKSGDFAVWNCTLVRGHDGPHRWPWPNEPGFFANKPQEPKAEEWFLHRYKDGMATTFLSREQHERLGMHGTCECVQVHSIQACQRERERLRGLLRHARNRDAYDLACPKCIEIEEALKDAPTKR